MKRKAILAVTIQAALICLLMALFQLTALARGGDDPPKIDTRSVSKLVSDSLFKLGCKSFLGRENDYLCKGREALFTCEAFKKAGEAKECRRDESGPKKILPDRTDAGIAADSLLKLGCKGFLGREDDFLCSTREARLTCEAFKAAGLAKECRAAGSLPPSQADSGADSSPKKIDSRSVNEVVSGDLFKLGCAHFLGRADDYICKTREARLTCETFKKDGKAKACRETKPLGPPKISPSSGTDAEVAGDSLVKLGCTHFIGRDNDYLCPQRDGMLACEAFKSEGLAKECRGWGKSN